MIAAMQFISRASKNIHFFNHIFSYYSSGNNIAFYGYRDNRKNIVIYQYVQNIHFVIFYGTFFAYFTRELNDC
jgi:hypothetical protein